MFPPDISVAETWNAGKHSVEILASLLNCLDLNVKDIIIYFLPLLSFPHERYSESDLQNQMSWKTNYVLLYLIK